MSQTATTAQRKSDRGRERGAEGVGEGEAANKSVK